MENKSSSTSVYDITIRLFIILLIVAWCLAIMYPFVSIILWSLILALAMHPLHSKLSGMMGGKPKLASFIIIVSILVVIFLPTWLLIDSLIDQVKALKMSYDQGTLSIPPPAEKVKELPVIGVIGGFIFSGFIGLFTGAIVMSIGYKLFIGWINDGTDREPDKIDY